MKRIVFLIFFGIVFLSFKSSNNPLEYEIYLEAKGCHYEIKINDQIVEEGKTYQKIFKTIPINKYLVDSVDEQLITLTIYRISREMSLKSTNAYANLKLDKKFPKSEIQTVWETKLPTFPYDEDEPGSIGTSKTFIAERQISFDSLQVKN